MSKLLPKEYYSTTRKLHVPVWELNEDDFDFHQSALILRWAQATENENLKTLVKNYIAFLQEGEGKNQLDVFDFVNKIRYRGEEE